MKGSLLLFFVHFLFVPVMGQSDTARTATRQGLRIAVSAGVQVPVGDFASTHVAGLGISVTPSYHTVSLLSKLKIAFTYNGGVAYYLGKKETVSGYSYTYPGYLFIHAFAGAFFIPSPKISFALTGGPAVGMYDGNTRFNLGGRLDLNYNLSSKVSIGPGILLMKETGADPLWAAFLKATLSF